jgi:xylan 1,4-beta-xylosidase
MMSYWTFSDVFEEQGVAHEPFYGGFGLMAERGLPKPAFNAFKLLHYLGSERIPVDSDSALVTRRLDGSLVIALWNLFPPEERGYAKQVSLSIKGLTGSHRAVISRVDETHGSLLSAYEAMGRPKSPTLAEIERLREAAELGSPETQQIEGGQLMISLPPQGLALIEIR